MLTKSLIAGILTGLFLSSAPFALDNCPPSPNPPNKLPSDNVPQFIVLGFDDQPTTAGMEAVVAMIKKFKNPSGKGQSSTFDGTNGNISFYSNSVNLVITKDTHKKAIAAGCEVTNHTASHGTGFQTSESQWKSEITQCTNELKSLGSKEILGFRTPFLQYNNGTFAAIKSLGFLYDCSIEEGWDSAQDASNMLWPYTLDNGSPGNKVMVDWQDPELPYELITSYPGIWEMPCYAIVIPPDSLCAKYGLPSRLRNRIKTTSNCASYFDTTNGKITGLDYNLHFEAGLNGMEIGKVLAYNFDCAYNGNRRPLNYGTHSRYYDGELPEGVEGLEYFLNYALQKSDTRIVSALQVVRWLQNPTPVDPDKKTTINVVQKTTTTNPMIKTFSHDKIDLSIAVPGSYSISLYTLNGKLVSTMNRSFASAGSHVVQWSVAPTSKVYIVSIQGKNTNESAKIILH